MGKQRFSLSTPLKKIRKFYSFVLEDSWSSLLPENQSGLGPIIVANDRRLYELDTVNVVDVSFSTFGNQSPFAVIILRITLCLDFELED